MPHPASDPGLWAAAKALLTSDTHFWGLLVNNILPSCYVRHLISDGTKVRLITGKPARPERKWSATVLEKTELETGKNPNSTLLSGPWHPASLYNQYDPYLQSQPQASCRETGGPGTRALGVCHVSIAHLALFMGKPASTASASLGEWEGWRICFCEMSHGYKFWWSLMGVMLGKEKCPSHGFPGSEIATCC